MCAQGGLMILEMKVLSWRCGPLNNLHDEYFLETILKTKLTLF
jgi:hypothetical protein